MEESSSLSEQIKAIEQLILQQSELYQNASEKKENMHSRLEILERIRVLQDLLQELKASLKA